MTNNKYIILVLLLLICSCEELIEPIVIEGCTIDTSCNYDDTATKDDGSCITPLGCNKWCDGDTTPILEFDCNSVCGGDGVDQVCGCGSAGEFGIPDGDCDCAGNVEDCLDECGGSAAIDNCSICVPEGDTTCIQGCDGIWKNDGTQVVFDECEVCGGNHSTCIDCAGTPNGTAILDNCEECVSAGDTSCVQGCDGIWINDGSQLVFDECGICDGDNSTCTDCNGDINGAAYIDGCGECVGGITGLIECTEDCTGDLGGTSFYDNCSVCVPEEDITCMQGCDGIWENDGTQVVFDECEVCGGNNSTCIDCAGTPNGSAILDNCEECVSAGDTSCVQGCDGTWKNDGSQLVFDECGICDGDNDDKDCSGVCFGTSTLDVCDVCNGDDTTCQDCNEDINGTAYIDGCGECVGGNTTLDACPTDCADVFGGTSLYDNCGECVPEGDTSCVFACDDIWYNNGLQPQLDECGICGGYGVNLFSCCEVNNNGFPDGTGPNGEVTVCNGVCGGNALLDVCGICDATYETQPAFPYGNCDCVGDVSGTAYIDLCGDCVEGNTGLNPCPKCDIWYMDNFVCDLDADVEMDQKCCEDDTGNDNSKCKIQSLDNTTGEIPNCNLDNCAREFTDVDLNGEPDCVLDFSGNPIYSTCSYTGYITYNITACGDGTDSCCTEPTCDEPFTFTSLDLEIDTPSNLQVNYSSTEAINAFQFDIVGATTDGGSGGDAGAYNLLVLGTGVSFLLGYDPGGGSIPAGSGILTNLNVTINADTDSLCIQNILVVDPFEVPVNSCPEFWQLTCIPIP